MVGQISKIKATVTATVKFLTIFDMIMLLGILFPVMTMATNDDTQIKLYVPPENIDLSIKCGNERSYSDEYLKRSLQKAKSEMNPQMCWPMRFEKLSYTEGSTYWTYPLLPNEIIYANNILEETQKLYGISITLSVPERVSQDFVVFDEKFKIMGGVQYEGDTQMFTHCSFTFPDLSKERRTKIENNLRRGYAQRDDFIWGEDRMSGPDLAWRIQDRGSPNWSRIIQMDNTCNFVRDRNDKNVASIQKTHGDKNSAWDETGLYFKHVYKHVKKCFASEHETKQHHQGHNRHSQPYRYRYSPADRSQSRYSSYSHDTSSGVDWGSTDIGSFEVSSDIDFGGGLSLDRSKKKKKEKSESQFIKDISAALAGLIVLGCEKSFECCANCGSP
ncbi:BgTH12-06542 [Blumeria graminis f. sp. triticale]|uniref:BgTH12-06542 n=1 Tax=Blumeria graminis f. sp. triticale TaxID=1689686 RepID=A0A9W4D2P0_BLUGR|nr:BgTH12-06542 [Blumeria graminis f. sp. triticale]